MADKQLLKKVKLVVGLSEEDTTQDDYISLLIEDTTEYITDSVVSITNTTFDKSYVTKEVTKGLGYVIRSVAVALYNRRGDEGTTETSVNSFRKTYLAMDKLMAPYLDAINKFAEKFELLNDDVVETSIQGTFFFM